MKTFYLTTPIYYPNARPHVGSAYTTIVCDVLARYKRMCGYDVAYLTGTDEHGEKLQRAAAEADKSPSDFVAEKRQLFVELWKKLGIQYDFFVYTDQPDHTISVQRMLIRARERGFIDKRRYEGRYCIWDERYISDGTDPVNCDVCGRPAELISEENYFFKLSKFGGEDGPLMTLYKNHPEFVQPDFRRNEVLSFVRSGLRDISVSRKRIKWGIPWPGDPEQVFYVWYDALIAYMTGIGYADGPEGNENFNKYWRNTPGSPNQPPGELVHMVGKDILRFHAIYWPAFIMAAYPDQPEMLPTTIFAHGWIYYEQDKMSKSKGNVVYPEPIVDAFEFFGAPGNDALRYYLLREAPFGEDTSFSYEALVDRYNSDLAKGLGNLASRIITMMNQYFGGVVPEKPSNLAEDEEKLKAEFFGGTDFLGSIHGSYRREGFDKFRVSLAAATVQLLASKLDGFLTRKEPWKIAGLAPEGGRQTLSNILYTATDALLSLAPILYPIAPRSAEHLWEQLGCEDYLGKIEHQRLDELKWGTLKPGSKVGKPGSIFPRLDKAKALAKLEELAEADRERSQPKGANVAVPSESQPEASVAQPPAAGTTDSSSPAAPQNDSKVPVTAEQSPITNHQSQMSGQSPISTKITIDDFAKVELVVGQILAAETMSNAKKLLKLQVDIGTETRQVCAGIAEYYKPEDLIGQKIVLVANLEPRKLRGVESNGMVVAASVGPEGRPVLATFKEDVPNGTRLK